MKHQLKVSIKPASINLFSFVSLSPSSFLKHSIANHLGSMIICFFHGCKDEVLKQLDPRSDVLGLQKRLLEKTVNMFSVYFKTTLSVECSCGPTAKKVGGNALGAALVEQEEGSSKAACLLETTIHCLLIAPISEHRQLA